MTIRGIMAAIVVLGIVMSAMPSRAQELERFEEQYEEKKEETKTDESKPLPKPEHRDREMSKEEREAKETFECYDYDNVLGCILGEIIFAPIKAFFAAISSDVKLPFSSYPYKYEQSEWAYLVPFGKGDSQTAGITASTAYQYVKPNVRGFIGQFQLRHESRLGVKASYIYYNEDLEQTNDSLSYFSLYANFAPGQGKRHIFDLGLGGIGLFGNNIHGGPALSLGVEIFPKKPFVIKMDAAFAVIKGDPLWDLSAEMGINFAQVEVLGGYRSLIGPEEDLSGPFAGVRIWF